MKGALLGDDEKDADDERAAELARAIVGADLVPALIAISSKTAKAAAAVASKGETKAAARARAEREERATQATGRTLDELHQWPIGALYALVAGPTAQRVLHRESGELALGLEPPKARRRRLSVNLCRASPLTWSGCRYSP